MNIYLTINYDDYWELFDGKSLSDDKTCVRWLLLHVSMWLGPRAALSLVKSYNPAVMHVVDTIFIISVSNSWMFTYHDKWNSHGKIVNSFCPAVFTLNATVCALNLWLLRQCEYNPQFRRSWEHSLTLLMSVIISFGISFGAGSFMYRDVSHLSHSSSHNSTKINIQFE